MKTKDFKRMLAMKSEVKKTDQVKVSDSKKVDEKSQIKKAGDSK